MASEAQDKLNDLSTQQLRDEVKKIYKKRRINNDGGIVNIIMKNIEQTQKDQVLNLERLKKETQEVKRTRLQQALEQRTFLFENHINFINAQREEKETRKQLMLANKMREIKQFQKSTFAFFWMTNIKIILMVSKFGDKLRNHRERQRLMRDMAFSLTRPFSKYRIKIKKLCGVSIQSRTLVDSFFSMYTYVKAKRVKTKENAEKALTYCLQANAWRFLVVQKINHYITTAIKVIHRVKHFHFKVNSFKKLLFRFWEKRYMELIPEIMQIKPEYLPLKDPTLAKRYIQNIYQSFNHLDLKRDAIDTYYRSLLHQYIINIRKYYPSQSINNRLQKNGTLFQVQQSESNNGGEGSIDNENNNNNNSNSRESLFNSSNQEIEQFQRQQQEQQMYYLHKQLVKQPSIQVQRQVNISSFQQIPGSQQQSGQNNKFKLLESINSITEQQECLIADIVGPDSRNNLMAQNNIGSNQILERLPTKLETQLIRLFMIPNRSQLKHLIYLEVFAVGQQYPDLLKKITFKYP